MRIVQIQGVTFHGNAKQKCISLVFTCSFENLMASEFSRFCFLVEQGVGGGGGGV